MDKDYKDYKDYKDQGVVGSVVVCGVCSRVAVWVWSVVANWAVQDYDSASSLAETSTTTTAPLL